MALPVLKLNLVPAPTLWRQRHEVLGWSGLALGLTALLASLATWGIQTARIKSTSSESIKLSLEAKKASQREFAVRQELATLDITRELPRWRLAERIYLERGLPWSRVTAELERSLVDGVRAKSLSRNRGADGTVELKIRGESRLRENEAQFIENLQQNGLFLQVVLEREAERQGGGIDFELRLPMVSNPPKYEPLPTAEARYKATQARLAKAKLAGAKGAQPTEPVRTAAPIPKTAPQPVRSFNPAPAPAPVVAPAPAPAPAPTQALPLMNRPRMQRNPEPNAQDPSGTPSGRRRRSSGSPNGGGDSQ